MENLSLPPGYSNDLKNQEMGVVLDEEKKKKSPIKSSSDHSIWPIVKPFVNGGATGTLVASQNYLIFSFLNYMPHVAKLTGCPKFAAQVKETLHNNQAYMTYFKADATLPAAQRMNNRNVFHTLYRIVADEGVLALWKGASPTVMATMALNMGMLASYNRSIDYFKESLGFGETRTRLSASAASGFFASACSLPYNHVLAQMKKMQRDVDGKYPYTGSLDCALKILKSRGSFFFYTGFPMYFVRMTPSIMVTWIILEEIRKFEDSIGL